MPTDSNTSEDTYSQRATPALDFSYAHSARFVPANYKHAHIVLVGAGGTGGYLAPAVARIARVMKDTNRSVEFTVVDFDRVEPKNIGRQNFCDAEVGEHKARALARRYSEAWGLEIRAITEPFAARMATRNYNQLTFLVGCVDNAQARRELAIAIDDGGHYYSGQVLWLDCGNHREAGQILFGTTTDAGSLRECFPVHKVCRALPAPTLQSPRLLKPEITLQEERQLSCAELMLLNQQSLMINSLMAAVAADYVGRILITGDLRRFATTVDLPSGTMRSDYITPETVARISGLPVESLVR